MACGKTTLGSALACAADVDFVDLDEAIEHATGMSVGQIFATRGEAEFRRLETDMLQQLATAEGHKIIACGGGTPCNGANLEFMLSNGTVVWLKADREATLRRLRLLGASRPLVAGKSLEELEHFVDNHYASRTPHYARAHEQFDSSHLESQAEIDLAVEQFITRFGLNRK